MSVESACRSRSITADELAALLAIREAYGSLQREHEEVRGTLRLVTAERDLAKERLRAYRHELPGAERFCANDGHALVEFGVEISEQLDVIPEQPRVIPHQRVKYACPCCDLGIKVTPAPPRIIPRGLLSESALAWIAAGKYQFGMPLYRQAGLLRRFGGDISSNTIAASMVRVGLATQPVINLMRDALLDAALIYCDETTLQVLKEEGCRPQTTSYLWAQMTGSGVPIRCLTYTPGRGTKLADKLFTGIREGAV
ncbi:IS66 family transposase, partial [Burkholderia cepacia]